MAVLSDIHGVLPALDAVLAEPDVLAAEAIVLTGDIAAGPLPVQTLDRLAALGDRAIWLRGNADRELVTAAGGGTTSIPDPIARWAASVLRPDDVDRLAALPYPVTLEIAGFGPVLCCHATPRDDQEIALVDSSPARWLEVLGGVDEDVRTIVCGHTHMPFLRLVGGRTVVNPGSVGMPYGGPGACWGLLHHGAVSLRRTDFDLDAACAAIARDSGYPGAAWWAAEYVRSRHSDLDALAVFGPLEGRAGGTATQP
ncbi:MAG: metallophosphoesterase family protein [Mycobacteriales bacterium]